MCSSTMSRGTAQSESGSPREKAKPALVVASALNPKPCRYLAVPTSHGLGITKHPLSCSFRNAARCAEKSICRPRDSAYPKFRLHIFCRAAINYADGKQRQREERRKEKA